MIAKPQVNALIGSADWRTMTDEDRDDAVRKIMKDSRADARGVLFGGSQPNALMPPPVSYAPPPGFDVIE